MPKYASGVVRGCALEYHNNCHHNYRIMTPEFFEVKKLGEVLIGYNLYHTPIPII